MNCFFKDMDKSKEKMVEVLRAISNNVKNLAVMAFVPNCGLHCLFYKEVYIDWGGIHINGLDKSLFTDEQWAKLDDAEKKVRHIDWEHIGDEFRFKAGNDGEPVIEIGCFYEHSKSSGGFWGVLSLCINVDLNAFS